MTLVQEKTSGKTATANGTNGHAPIPHTHEELIEALMQTEGKAEIINGRIVRFMASGDLPGDASLSIAMALKAWKRATDATGRAASDGTGFLCDLPRRQSFEPDASYYTGERSGMKFLPTPPVFAVEIRSEGDYGEAAERDMTAKRADYFATGATEVVWDVDLLGASVIVRKYTKAGGEKTPVATFGRGDTADAEPAVPGFTMPVDDLFE